MTKQIAILGAGGYFGSCWIEQSLSRSDLSLRPILRSYRGLAALCRFGMDCQIVDTAKADALAAAMKGCSVVLNLTMGDSTRILSDTRIIYEAARSAGAGLLIHMSSAVIYGSVQHEKIDDDSPAQGAKWNLYAREKAQSEGFLRKVLSNGNPRIVVLRPFLIWGPRSRWTIQPARELLQGRAWLANNGEGICNLCYGDNLVRYIHRVIDSPTQAAGFYNVGDPDTVTWKQYYESLALGLGLPLDRVRRMPPASFRYSAVAAGEWLRQQRPVYKASRWLLDRLSGESKALLKYHLPALAGGRAAPPLGQDEFPPPSPPGFTRDQWSAHFTPRKLSGAKFWRDFGRPQLVPFSQAMEATTTWLRLAGFADY